MKKYVCRNLKLYLFWFVLLLPITLYNRREVYFGSGVLRGVHNFVTGALFGSTFVASWYIMAGVIGTLVVYYLSRKLGNKALLATFIPLYILITLRSGYFSLFTGMEPVVSAERAIAAVLGNPAQSWLVAPFWITCGKCFADDTFRIKGRVSGALCLLSCILLYGEWNLVRWLDGSLDCDCYFVLPLVCIFAFAWLKSREELVLDSSIELRRCSTVVYALHGSALVLIKGVCRRALHVDEPALYFLLAVAVCLWAYLFIRMITRRGGWLSRLFKNAF